MRRFFAMLRYSKKLLIITIATLIDVLLMLGLIVFDVVQFALLKNNSAMLSAAFIPINIVLIVLAGLNLIAVIGFMIYRKRKETSNEAQ